VGSEENLCTRCRQALPVEAQFCFVCGAPQGTERMAAPLVAAGTEETVRAGTGEGLALAEAASSIPRTRVGPPAQAPTAEQAELADPLIGTLIAERFRVRAPLGAGGMGSVYLAEQVAVGRPVVLKFLHRRLSSDRELTERFHREALAASRLSCPNTIVLHDFGQTADGVLYMAMELLEGRTLAALVESAGALAPIRAVGIAIQILASLAEAHEKGIVHRDLKPENIMLVERGGTSDFVKVLDFGIAKMVGLEDGRPAAQPGGTPSSPELTQQGEIFGSPRYMSPEQILGEPVDPRADLYALGAILYLMLTGHTPIDGSSTMALFEAHLKAKVPLIRERFPELALPEALDRLIHRCLSKRPEGRPASAGELADQLRELIPAIAEQQDAQERALLEIVGIRRRWPRFGRLTWAALAAALALAIALGAVLVLRGGSAREGTEVLAPGERLFVSASAARVPAWVDRPGLTTGAVGVMRGHASREHALQLAEGAALGILAELPERYAPERERSLYLSDLRAAHARGRELATLARGLARESFWAKHVLGLEGGERRYVYDAFVRLATPDAAARAALSTGFAELRARRYEFLLDSAIQRGRCEEAKTIAPKVREAISLGDEKKATKDRMLYYVDFKLGRCQPTPSR
jgi:hypothetical protein